MRRWNAPICLLSILVAAPAMAGVTHSVNPENGLQGWNFQAGDIGIELIQRLPDQTRALFMNHAFSRAVIEQLALSCMFQTIIRNTDATGRGQAVGIDLTRWRMHADTRSGDIVLKEPLLASWSDADASADARRMLRWGMFPTQQEYLPGDYNWGLTAYGIAPGTRFDLEVHWTEAGVEQSGTISNLLCAPDVDKLK